MKEDNISQLGDYDAPFCEQQYTQLIRIIRKGLIISL